MATRQHRYARLVGVLVVGCGLLPVLAGVSAAAPPTPSCENPDALGVASSFSEFVRDDAGRISDSEGRVAIGGDATLGSADRQIGFSVGSGQPVDSVGVPLPDDGDRHDLIVGGALHAYRVDVIHAGARYGSLTSAPGTVSSSIGGSVTAGPPTQHADGSDPIDFDAEFAGLQAKADSWGELAATGSVTGSGQLDLTGDEPGLNVFHLTTTQLTSANSIRIRVPAGATILVDVAGTAVDLSAGPLGTVSIWDPVTGQYIVDDHFIGGRPVPSTVWLTLRQSLLWNFPATTTFLKNSVSWPGTILAPQAHLQFGRGTAIGPGHVDGSIVVRSVDSVPGAETHDMTFVGLCLPPEPAPLGAITLRKVVSGTPPDSDTTFTFAVDCGTAGGRHTVPVPVAAGATSGSARLDGLPVGVTCTVAEPDPPPGWQLGPISPSSVIVPADDEPEVSVVATNARQVGSLRLVKRLDGPASVAGQVTLHVSCTDGTARDVVLTVPAGSTSASATIAPIAVAAVCRVTETATDPNWTPGQISPTSVQIGDPNDPPVVVTAADARRLGALQLVKTTTAPPTVDTTFTFTVDCDGTAFDRRVPITVPAGQTSASAVPLTGLPFGTTCAVTEVDVPAGWSVHDISPASVVVGAGGAATVTVTATDARQLAGVALIKRVTGPVDGVGHSFGLHVACSDGFAADAAIAVPAGSTSGRTELGGITSGATCTVTEPDQPPGFAPVTIDPASVTVGAAGTPPVEVTATDAHLIGELAVEKRLTSAAATDVTFELTLDCDGTAFDQRVSLPIAAGAELVRRTLTGLPLGLHCEPTEPEPSAPYRLVEITPTDGITVGADAAATLTAVNDRELGAVWIVKRLEGGPSDHPTIVRLRLACTGPDVTRRVVAVIPAGRHTEAILVDGVPVGARCTVDEARPDAPFGFVGVSPASVVVGTGEPVVLTVRNVMRTYEVRVVKRLTSLAPSGARFSFLLACNDPTYDRDVRVSIAAGGTAGTVRSAAIPVTVACTVSEPEQDGWHLVSRSPVDGTATDTAATITFVNAADGAVAATGPVAAMGLLRLALLLLGAGVLCGAAGVTTAGRGRHRRR